MTKKQNDANEYLTQIRNADREITDMILQIDFLRYKASGAGAIRYDKDRVQTSPEDMMCSALSEAVTLEGKLSSRSRKLQQMRKHTEEVIGLWNNRQAKFIEVYYLNHGSMVDVARELKCSDRNAYFIRMKALEQFYNYL